MNWWKRRHSCGRYRAGIWIVRRSRRRRWIFWRSRSWRILKVERGVVRVADAKGQPPTIPFWLGEGPSRTPELSAEIAKLREEVREPGSLTEQIRIPQEAALQISEFIADGRRVLG